jgi:hypothetical protein
MAQISVQSSKLTGVAHTYVAADSLGDSFINNGATILEVKNADTVDVTVTVDSQQLCSFGHDHNINVVVPAGETRIIGTFNRIRFNDSDNRVNVSYSSVTSLTVAAVSTV